MTLQHLRGLPLDELEEQVIFSEWRRLRHASTRSLSRTRQLMDLLGYRPSDVQHLIMGVVGSKGKGTATAYASAALASQGHYVGTVMSPGAISNADRILIQGKPVAPDIRRSTLLRIAEGIQRLPGADAASGYLAPTGLFMLMGMLIHQQSGCTAVVMEAGIGGRSDDLSHWPLDAAVITQIFGEHLDLLGPSIVDVAYDKAGVITDRTRLAVILEQSEEARRGIRCHTDRLARAPREPQHSAEAESSVSHLPSGFSQLNAYAGVSAALELLRSHDQNHLLNSPALHKVLASVQYPGRLSEHPAGSGRCLVDSAVSAEGLKAAVDYARHRWGHWPEQVLVCLPEGKDLAGFVQVLADVPSEPIFVSFPQGYLPMPDRETWPWKWCTDADLQVLLNNRETAAVGTVLFTSAVLSHLGVQARPLFQLSGNSPE